MRDLLAAPRPSGLMGRHRKGTAASWSVLYQGLVEILEHARKGGYQGQGIVERGARHMQRGVWHLAPDNHAS
jgi:hypothetical protein